MRLYIICCIAIWAYALKMDKYQQQEAVYWHNKARSEIAEAGLCANMLEMTWNDGVADAAANNRCPNNKTQLLHNKKATKAYGKQLGENLAGSINNGLCTNGGLCREAICGRNGAPECELNCETQTCTLLSAIYKRWYLREKDTTTNNCKPFKSGGSHCSQVVWPDSTEVGCTYQTGCSGLDVIVACNYNPAGNMDIPDGSKVYLGKCIEGPACTKCPQGYSCNQIGLCSKNPPGSVTRPTRRPTRRPTSPTITRPTRRPTIRRPTRKTCPPARPFVTCEYQETNNRCVCKPTVKVSAITDSDDSNFSDDDDESPGKGNSKGKGNSTSSEGKSKGKGKDPDTDTDTDTDTSNGNSTSSEGKSKGKGKGNGNVTFEVSAITDSDDSDFSDNDDESPDAVLGEVVLAAAPSQFQVVLPCFIVVVLTLLQLL